MNQSDKTVKRNTIIVRDANDSYKKLMLQQF